MKSFSRSSKNQRKTQASPGTSKRGFTLMQIVVVMAVIAVLSTFLLSSFGQSRAMAHRADCDVNLKAITMALDAFRQENGHYPGMLTELVQKKYLTDVSMLKCPSDPRPNGSYDDFYIMRSGRGSSELPILVCPLCASESGQAVQAYRGRYTKQFATKPAELTEASATTITRPGKKAIAGRAGMQLRGGDTISTDAGGQAKIKFADGSVTEMSGGSEITVLQSFVAGHMRAPLYTLVNQTIGDVRYRVHHGSKFDVTTPTATAGALGTEFVIRSDTSGAWWLKVVESKVYVSNFDQRIVIAASENELKLSNPDGTIDGSPVMVTADWIPVGQQESSAQVTPEATPTPSTPNSSGSTTSPTPTPVATPTPSTVSDLVQSNSSRKNPRFKRRSGHGKLGKLDDN